jgi:uncharacterized membrane protein YhaH (DUF805 family)
MMAYVEYGSKLTAAQGAVTKIFSCRGRADRSEFRRGAPALSAAAALALIAGAAALAPWSLAAPLAGACGAALVALTVRRLHDVGAGGWFVWLQLLILSTMIATGAAIHGHTVGLLLGEGLLGSMALAMILLVAATWRRVSRCGDLGQNRYGPAPR